MRLTHPMLAPGPAADRRRSAPGIFASPTMLLAGRMSLVCTVPAAERTAVPGMRARAAGALAQRFGERDAQSAHLPPSRKALAWALRADPDRASACAMRRAPTCRRRAWHWPVHCTPTLTPEPTQWSVRMGCFDQVRTCPLHRTEMRTRQSKPPGAETTPCRLASSHEGQAALTLTKPKSHLSILRRQRGGPLRSAGCQLAELLAQAGGGLTVALHLRHLRT